MSAHTRNECYAPSIPELYHLFGRRLRRHEDPGNVDLEHHIRIVRRILQRRRFLLDPRRRN